MTDTAVVLETPQQRYQRLGAAIDGLNGATAADPELKALLREMLGPEPQAVQPPVDADFTTPRWMQNEVYPAQLDRGLISSIWVQQGVIGPSDFQVAQRALGTNLSVDVAAGAAVIAGTDAPNQQRYMVRLLAFKNRTLAAAPGAGLQRIDVVGLQVWDQAVIGATSNPPWNVVVLTGTAAASPVAPAYPNSFLPLAQIGPITSTTAQITNALISERRTLTGNTPAPIQVVQPSGTNQVIFDNIPQLYTDLKITGKCAVNNASGSIDNLLVQVNDVVGANYASWHLYAVGGGPSGGTSGTNPNTRGYLGQVQNAGIGNNTVMDVTVPRYRRPQAGLGRDFDSFNFSLSGWAVAIVIWRHCWYYGQEAIRKIRLFTESGATFAADSSFELYGIL
jgi:hypothetical protein